MKKVIVSDASPLIALAKLDCLDLLLGIFSKIYIPSAVYHESTINQYRLDSKRIISFATQHARICEDRNNKKYEKFKTILGEGESQALVLAMDMNCGLLIDERLGRAEEFIAAITQHIPEKSFQMLRYYGHYSNRARGERRKKNNQKDDLDTTATPEDVEVIDVSSYKPRRIPSKTWRDFTPRAFASRHIKKIWEVDHPLECPKCHAEMKIISFISKSQPVVIRR